jgi:hypothetical protein
MAEINDLNVTDASNTARFPENQLPSTVNNGARALEGIIARWDKDTNGSITPGGTADVITIAANQTLSAYYDGLVIAFEAAGTNTGAVTVNVDALGAKSIVKPDGSAMAAGDIVSGSKVIIIYDGTNFQIVSAYIDTTQSTLAENWATKIDGVVESSEYSSKAYAIGGTGVTDTAGKGAAKEWATAAEDDTVDGSEYSAKHYSIKSNASAVASAASAVTAAASETAAAASETAAGVSETNAAASAVAAAASIGGVKVSTNDTTPGDLEAKILVSASLALTTQNDGANETRTIDVADGGIGATELATNAVETIKINDDAVTLAKMASGTAGNIITYDASGDPAAVATGTVGQVLTSGGAGVAPTMQDAAGGGLQSVQVFTASGTWTKPAGITKVRVRLVGGGGGSAGCDSTGAGGSGAAGGYSEEFIDVSGTSSESVTIGAAGAAGSSGNNAGGAGGTTSFGAFLSATGGGGGVVESASEGASGGVGTGGDINLTGGGGGCGTADGSHDGANLGGASFFGGGGGAAAYNDLPPTAQAGAAPGSGAGGVNGRSNAAAGAVGAAGIVIVEEYA